MKSFYAIFLFSLITIALSAQNNRWDNQFTVINSPDDTVFAIEGSYNKLFVGGAFHNVAGIAANHIAQFNGTSWNSMGTGVNGNVYAIINFNLGTIVGGSFSSAGGVTAENFAIWDGTSWTAPGNTCNGAVRALLVLDQYLYVGGDFTTIGGINANHIARYNGTTWEAIGTGVDGPVYCIHQGADLNLKAHSDFADLGVDNSMYFNNKGFFLNVGGNFANAGGLPANNIARWNGVEWSSIGNGFNNRVSSITVLGSQIIAAGSFTQSGTNTINYIAKWNDIQWIPFDIEPNGIIRSVEQIGSDLYACGNFNMAGTINTNNIALWDGTNWSSLGDGLNKQGFCLKYSDYDLYCGGSFTIAGLNPSNNIGRYFSPPTIEQQSGLVKKCQGDSMSLIINATGSNPITYQWYKNGIATGINNDTLLVFPLQISDAGIYSCVLTNNIGTAISDSIPVEIFQEPLFSTIQTDTSLCEGIPLNLIVSETGTNPSSLQWYYNTSKINGEINDTLYFNSVATSNNGIYFCKATNLCGDDTSFFNITIHALPTVSFSGLSSEYCVNDTADALIGNPSGGIFSGNGITDTIFSPSGLIGNHTIYYNYTDLNGCIGSTSQSTLVHTLPLVSFTGLAENYCSYSLSDTLQVNPVGGVFYGSGINDSIFTPSIAGQGTHTLYYAYTGGNGCTNIMSQTTIVYAQQVFSYSELDTSFCINDNVYNIQVTPSGGIFSGTGITGNSFNPQIAGIGPHQIFYQYTDLHGCISNDSMNIQVNALPMLSFTHISPEYCKNAILDTLIASPVGGNFWGNNITNDVLNPSLFTPGQYFAYYTFTDSLGCTNTDSASFTVINAITVLFTGITTFYCENETSDTLLGIPQGGVFSGPGVNGNIFSPTLAGSGTHPVIYTYNNMNGCFSYDSVDVTVAALPNIQIGSDTAICFGDTLTLIAKYDAGTLLWNTGSTNSFINVFPSILTSYFVNLYTENCHNSDTIWVNVNPKPSINLGSDTSMCSPAIIKAPSGYTSYIWSNNSLDTAIIVITSGIYSLTITNDFACSQSDSILLNILPTPQVDLGQDQAISGLQTIILGTSPNYDSYLWNTGSTQNYIIVTGSILGEGSFHYWLTAHNVIGCSASDTILVTVIGDVGFNENEQNTLISVYPNPVKDFINISLPKNSEKPFSIIITSSIGEKLIELDKLSISESINKIDIRQLTKGLYFIQINFKNYITINKIIIN